MEIYPVAVITHVQSEMPERTMSTQLFHFAKAKAKATETQQNLAKCRAGSRRTPQGHAALIRANLQTPQLRTDHITVIADEDF